MTYALTAQAPEGMIRIASERDASELWHQRLGHPGERKTQLIAALEGAPQGLEHVECCETCSTTKNTQSVSRAPSARATQPLGRVHVDFWGPYHEATIAGKRYMLTITDDYTRKSWIYLTADRTDVYAIFRQWQAATELESGHRLKAVRMDNAPELVKLGSQLERAGLRVELTVAYTPSQNGVAERLNRTLITKARGLLATAGLPERLWGEAVHTANYLRNLTPLEDEKKSPKELWTSRPQNIGHLRVFGCVAYAYIPAARRAKLQPTAAKGIFV
jgi:transposase InsO family protein